MNDYVDNQKILLGTSVNCTDEKIAEIKGERRDLWVNTVLHLENQNTAHTGTRFKINRFEEISLRLKMIKFNGNIFDNLKTKRNSEANEAACYLYKLFREKK